MIVKLAWEHAIHIAQHLRDADFCEVMANRWDDNPLAFAAECMALPGVKQACLSKSGEPVAMGGIAAHLPGVGQAWLVGTPEIGLHGIEMAHACKGLIRRLFEANSVHRVQAFSAATHTQAHQWLRRIGFREESRMAAFGKNKEDFLTFCVVKGD
jgi:RimJ/RimL family protein N-acetyltransferase